jgi:hypothetical protein
MKSRTVICEAYLDTKMPKKLVDKSQAYFWTRKWQEGEREAEEDIKAGRVKAFDSVEELISDPDR